MSTKKIIQGVTDVLIGFACLFAIAMFIVVMVCSLKYFSAVMTDSIRAELNAKMFWIGLIVAIIYTSSQFIIEFIKSFAKTFKPYFKKKKNGL